MHIAHVTSVNHSGLAIFIYLFIYLFIYMDYYGLLDAALCHTCKSDVHCFQFLSSKLYHLRVSVRCWAILLLSGCELNVRSAEGEETFSTETKHLSVKLDGVVSTGLNSRWPNWGQFLLHGRLSLACLHSLRLLIISWFGVTSLLSDSVTKNVLKMKWKSSVWIQVIKYHVMYWCKKNTIIWNFKYLGDFQMDMPFVQ